MLQIVVQLLEIGIPSEAESRLLNINGHNVDVEHHMVVDLHMIV